MRYTVTKSVIQVVGKIWMPAITAAMEYPVRPNDLKDESGEITKESIERWIMLHTGDFQSIEDWKADISWEDKDIVISWHTEDGEMKYNDCMEMCSDD